MKIAAPPPHGVLAVVGDSAPTFPANLLGTSVRGRYRLDGIMQEQADSVVFQANNLRTGNTVSLRLATPQAHADGSRSVEQEGELLAALDHERIPRLIDRGMTEDGLAYLATEYIEGRPLSEPVDAAAAVRLIAQALDALHYLHTKQIIHGDLSPASFVVTGSQDQSQLRLIDVPDATRGGRDSSLTVSDLTAGAPGYMAPEQIVGDVVDARSDLYTLGVIFHELLTGQRAWGSSDPEELVEIQLARSLSSLPPEAAAYDPILQRLSARDPTDRYASAVVALEALEVAFLGRGPRRISEEIEAHAEHLTVAKGQESDAFPADKKSSSSRLPWLFAFTGIAAAGLFGWWLASGASDRLEETEPAQVVRASSVLPAEKDAPAQLEAAGAIDKPEPTPTVTPSANDAAPVEKLDEPAVDPQAAPTPAARTETVEKAPRRRRRQARPAAPAMPVDETADASATPEVAADEAAPEKPEASPAPAEPEAAPKLLDSPTAGPADESGLMAPKSQRDRPSADVLLSH